MANKRKTLKGLAKKIRALYTAANAISPLFQSQGTMVGKLEWLSEGSREGRCVYTVCIVALSLCLSCLNTGKGTLFSSVIILWPEA